MKKIALFIIMAVLFTACSRTEESSSTTSDGSSSSTQTKTSVKMNVINAQQVPQSGIIVMMFKTKVSSSSNLPTIEKQVTSDSNGLANFDLSSYITSDIAQTYYFEAFKMQGSNYVWVSTIHPEISIKKNTQITTSISIN